MKTMTCDSAKKAIQQLQADRDAILAKENINKTYSYCSGEDPVIPEYDFTGTQARLDELMEKIITLKKAIHANNATTILPNTEKKMTVDEALIRMAFLTKEKTKLERMRSTTKTTRTSTLRGSSEYTVCNYDFEEVEARYQKVSDELTAIQQGLNIVNMTVEFKVDI